MITLKDFLECIEYRVSEGDKYCWQCYGENAMSMDHWNGKLGTEGMSIHVVFDTVDQTVYEMQAWDYRNGREYRWFHPGFKAKHAEEGERLGIDTTKSFDDNVFIDLDVAEDMLEKARAIFRGEEYDTRIVIQLEMTAEEELFLLRAAHAADMSVNDFVVMALQKKIDELKRNSQ